MGNGKYFSGPAALLVLLFFFLPWVVGSCNGTELGAVSGLSAATGANGEAAALPLLWGMPLVAVGVLLLLLIAWRLPPQTAVLAAVSVLLTAVSIGALLWLYSQLRHETFSLVTQPALFGTLIGLLFMLIGGLLDWLLPPAPEPSATPVAPSSAAGAPPAPPSVETLAEAEWEPPLTPPETAVDDAPPAPAPPQPPAPPPAPLPEPDPPPLIWATDTPAAAPVEIPATERLAAPSMTLAWLIVQAGETVGKRYRIDGTMQLGRDPNSDIVLNDTAVSGTHGQIELANGRFRYTDFNSTNGSFARQTATDAWRQIAEIELTDGVHLKLGRTVFHFISLAAQSSRNEP